jgi:hypothetical protein
LNLTLRIWRVAVSTTTVARNPGVETSFRYAGWPSPKRNFIPPSSVAWPQAIWVSPPPDAHTVGAVL